MNSFSLDDLTVLHDQGILSHLDYYFATTMAGIFKQAGPLELLAAAMTSRALANGHVCLHLDTAAGTPLQAPDERMVICLPEIEPWLAVLETSPMVGKEADHTQIPGQPAWYCQYPLVLDLDNHLYLSRYYDFQCRLARNMIHRIKKSIPGPDETFAETGIASYFKDQDPATTFHQQQAIKKALLTGFTIISGGPGTGKTYVTNIIRNLLAQWAEKTGRAPLRVLSLAPTGKAASRLKNGVTIHGALKPLNNSPGFIHHADYPLAADLVIIDEASMIDMALMTRLMEAVSADTRVVMLGDKNQLSPVQAGSVFTDFCGADRLENHRVFLTYNFRSKGQPGIEALARAVNDSDGNAVEKILSAHEFADVIFKDTSLLKTYENHLESFLNQGYEPLFSSQSAEQALGAADRFRVLCAHNSGPGGTLQINHLCENILRSQDKNDINSPIFKRLLMVRRNDYKRLLFNGDTGVVLGHKGVSTAWFETQTKEVRHFRLADLPESDSAFAVTIHKSQGSEFDTVLILIPEQISPVVTRQLLYTGITRARKKVIVFGSLPLIKQALKAPVERRSNLLAALKKGIF